MQILFFFRFLIALVTPTSDADAEALHRFAPRYVTVDAAREHVWAARAAAAAYGVDADTTLAIAYHESRFTDGAVTKEVGNRVSCGAMTPFPTQKCVSKSLLAQYLDGTKHWAVDWGTARDVHGWKEVLRGYAGGYRLIRRCRKGPVLRHKTHGDDLCRTPDVFAQIRARIIEARLIRKTQDNS